MKNQALREQIQTLLKAQGFYNGAIDGELGPASDRAWQSLKAATDADPVRGGAVVRMTSPFLMELLRLADGEIGTKEAGTNNGKRVNEYQSADWLEGGGYAWCASFICWLVQQALAKHPMSFDRPKTAGAWDFERWAKEQAGKGVKLFKPASETSILPGDIVVFRFSHIGLAVQEQRNGAVVTIEGNTNGAGSSEGDGVYKKSRSLSQIRSVIRLA